MHIYIDESGSFVLPTSRRPRVSCVTALIVPSEAAGQVLADFEALRASWKQGDEVKGSALHEAQTAAVARLLAQYDCVFFACATDMSLYTEQQLSVFKSGQESKIRAGVGEHHHPNLVRQVHEMADQLERLPNQLLVQTFLNWILVDDVLRYAPLYYVQRVPAELGEFVWRIDAKDKIKTEYEELWTCLILPIIFTHSLTDPMALLKGADYRHFARYNADKKSVEQMREWQPDMIDPAPPVPVDIRKVLSDLSFEDSRTDSRIQLVDTVASTFTRALNGQLMKIGWIALGRIMLGNLKMTPRMILLSDDQVLAQRQLPVRRTHAAVLTSWSNVAKSAFP